MTDALRIGKYEIKGGILAPMAGYTDVAFRELCRAYGAGLTVTEMVSVRGLAHGNAATKELMRLSPLETPSCVQVFGNDPDDFSRAAELISADIIDINMGCPMPKIVKNGDGAALLKTPERAHAIVKALKNATDKPITVKTRLGYGMGEDGAADLVEAVADAGAAAVAIHGRYAEQRYAGSASYDVIREIARRTTVPVIVNGDLDMVTPEPPFAAVMIGRAALGNPAVFSGGHAEPFSAARRHVRLLVDYFDQRYAVIQARKFFVHYFKGVRGGKALRDAVNGAQSADEIYRALDNAQSSVYN